MIPHHIAEHKFHATWRALTPVARIAAASYTLCAITAGLSGHDGTAATFALIALALSSLARA